MLFLRDRYWLRSQWDTVLVCLTFLIGIAVSNSPKVLSLRHLPNFTNWFDQGKYLKSATAFFGGNLNAGEHWYPLLYPLLIGCFSWLPPLLATLIPDLLCYAITYIAYREVCQRFNISRHAAVLLFLPATIVYYQTGDGWLQPWTTTLSAALIWCALALGGRILDSSDKTRIEPKSYVLLGSILGAIPLCRPADVVVSGMIGLCLVYAMLRKRHLWSAFSTVLLSSLAVFSAGIILHLTIYGPHVSDYMKLSAAYGTNFRWLGWKAYLILVEPLPWYPFGQGLLKILPWLPLGAAGILVNTANAGKRAQTLLLLLPALAYLAVMLAYIDLLPSGLWRYSNFHYFKWMIPLFAAFAWIFVREFSRNKTASVIALISVIIPSSLHIMPVIAQPNEAARMVTFHDVPAPFADVYFARSVLKDRQGMLLNSFDYHQVPDNHHLVLAEALRRDFAGDEHWIHPGHIAKWPEPISNSEPIPPLPGTFPKAPVARYKPEVTIGWPCWLPPYGCRKLLP